jgi:hypothetical protein
MKYLISIMKFVETKNREEDMIIIEKNERN